MEDIAPLLSEIAGLLRHRNTIEEERLNIEKARQDHWLAFQKRMDERRENGDGSTSTGLDGLRARREAREIKQDEFKDSILAELRELNTNLNKLYLHQSGVREVD